MARGRHTGKHRAQRGHRLLSSLVVTLSMAAAVAAVVLAVVATDPRLLRAAVAVGLVAALAPVLLPSRRAEPAGPGRDEWRALRRELAELRGELDAYLATSSPPAREQRPAPVATLSLPLVRAALAVPVPANGNGNGHSGNGQNGNGHSANGHSANGWPHTIDLTDDAASLSAQ